MESIKIKLPTSIKVLENDEFTKISKFSKLSSAVKLSEMLSVKS